MPYFFISPPWSPYSSAKTSGMPMRLKRRPASRSVSASSSETALPRPPTRLCSSTVSTTRAAAARSRTAGTSSGLTVGRCSTPACTPAAFNLSAAARHTCKATPVHTSRASRPSRIGTAWPMTKGPVSVVTTGSCPLAKRT